MSTNKDNLTCLKKDGIKILKDIIDLQKLEVSLYKKLEPFAAFVKNKSEYDSVIKEVNKVFADRKSLFSKLYAAFENEKLDYNKIIDDINGLIKFERTIYKKLESFYDSLKTKPEYQVVVEEIIKVSDKRNGMINKLIITFENIKIDHLKILNNIINLQNLEAALYKKLEFSAAAKKNKAEYDEILKEINRMSDERNKMFNTLNSSFESVKSYNEYKKSELADKLDLAQVMENDLNNKKRMQNSLAANKADKMRMVEINTYNASKYNAQADMMKIIIVVCVPLLIITILSKKGIIPENIADIIMALVLVIGVGIIAVKFYDISIRNNMNFEEYEWGVKPSSLPVTTAASKPPQSSKHLFDSILNFGCVGEKCCSDGMYYDDMKEQCLTGIKPDATVEGFCQQQYSPVVPFNSTQTDYSYV